MPATASAGDENDNAVGQAIMNVLKAVAQAIELLRAGRRSLRQGSSRPAPAAPASKESSGDLVLACLGDKELTGSVTNTRLAVRKNRGGRQGQEYPVRAAGGDGAGAGRGWRADHHDGGGLEPGPVPETQSGPDDPWAKPKRQDQRTAALRLKRVLMAILAEQGVDLPIAPDGPVVRMVDQKLVREAFYACTPADGTPEQKRTVPAPAVPCGTRLGRETSS